MSNAPRKCYCAKDGVETAKLCASYELLTEMLYYPWKFIVLLVRNFGIKRIFLHATPTFLVCRPCRRYSVILIVFIALWKRTKMKENKQKRTLTDCVVNGAWPMGTFSIFNGFNECMLMKACMNICTLFERLLNFWVWVYIVCFSDGDRRH